MHTQIFKNIILPLKDTLFGIAWRITQSRTDAEDIVQDVLLKMWSIRKEWEGMNSIGAYCVTMVKNRALTRIQNKKISIKNRDDGKEYDSAVGIDNPHQQIEYRDQYTIVRQVLAELSEQQQQIMMLREFEGKTYAEIAEVLNINEGQVKIGLFRARQIVREKIHKINSYGL